MLGLNREVLEFAVIGLTTIRIGYSLWTAAGVGWELVGLFCVSVAATAQEIVSGQHRAIYGYDTKPADSEGLTLGTVTLPWTFTALLITDLLQKGSSGYSLLACRSALASSTCMLLWLSGRACYMFNLKRSSSTSPPPSTPQQRFHQAPPPITPKSPPPQISTPPVTSDVEAGSNASRLNRRMPNHQGRNAARFQLIQNARQAIPSLKLQENRGEGLMIGILAALLFILLCIPLLPGGLVSGVPGWMGHFSSTAGMALNATVAAGILHLMLKHFPRCFTLGEAMVVAQSLAFLATDSASLLMALTASSLHSSPSLFNPPSSPDKPPHPLLTAQMDTVTATMPNRGAGGLNSSRSIRNMILDSIYETQNFGKGWWGYNIMPRAPAAVFVELLVTISLVLALVLTPLTQRVVQKLWRQRKVTWHTPMFVGLVLLSVAAAIKPALWVLAFAMGTSRRQTLLAYWVVLLALVVPLIHWLSAAHAVPTILVRKGYHLLALGLFLPALLWEPQLLAVSLAIALALLVVLEIVRIGEIPYIGDYIHKFMMSFTDGRDAGVLLVSHFSLLTGMAVPIWLSSITTTPISSRHEVSDPSSLDLPQFGRSSTVTRAGAVTPLPLTAFAGIMILGIADSAASAIGKRYGRHRICIGTKKTVEGTLGAALLTLLGWALLAIVFQSHLSHSASASWDGLAGAKLLISTLLSCLLEASTTQLDNIFMPLHYLAMLSL
ncbi:hypothetical protein WJX79_000184 [Trebouxia sp. C0005]